MGVVLYDGVCALCNASVRFLLAVDREHRLRYAPLQGETGASVLSRHPDADRTLSTMLYVRDLEQDTERLFDRSDAAFAILREVGGVWSVFSWLRVLPRFVRDGVYEMVAKRRYRWFGKYDTCPIPDPDVAKRFLP